MNFINKQELKYISLSAIFLFLLFVFGIPKLYDPSMPSWLAFVVFNLAVVIFMQVFLKSVVTKKKPTIKGAIGFTFLIIGLGIISPPFAVDFNGLTNTSMFLGNASIDYNVSLLWQNAGFSGIGLYFMTYIVSSLMCFLLSALFIKNFLNDIDGA